MLSICITFNCSKHFISKSLIYIYILYIYIYINDLDDDITSKVLMFADDTKMFRTIKGDADRQHLQDDLIRYVCS